LIETLKYYAAILARPPVLTAQVALHDAKQQRGIKTGAKNAGKPIAQIGFAAI
tara:strand:- start:2599 stop:2757 length:159 start_codon:yes stop_codon:yes gene_type:complete